MMSSGRYFPQVYVELPNLEKITLIGVHLDVYDNTEETRLKEMRQLLNLTSKLGINSSHAILGDFNSLRRLDYSDARWEFFLKHDQLRNVTTKSGVIDLIEKNGFSEIFTINGVPVPQCTTWNGRRIDFIFLSETWKYPILGCFVYHDATSDHVPVICDFAM